MARETIFRCDVDGTEEDVRTVRYIADGATWEIDLCKKHREQVMRIVKHGREVSTGGAGRKDPHRTYDQMVRDVKE